MIVLVLYIISLGQSVVFPSDYFKVVRKCSTKGITVVFMNRHI